MNARMRPIGQGTRFVHTLSGSGRGGRACLVAVLEIIKNAGGSVTDTGGAAQLPGGLREQIVP